MHLRRRKGHSRLRRASVMVQSVIFGSTVGLGVAALAVDTGLMFSSKQELQNAADAAALAAASQLGAGVDPTGTASLEAATYAAKNKVAGLAASLNIATGVVFGHAAMNGEKFDFWPNEMPYDAVEVTLRRDATVADGPVSLLFAKTFGMEGARLHASATAMIVPRDIAVVIDLSASMNDDSELRHYKEFESESGGTREGVQVNTKDIWIVLPIMKGNAGVGNGLDPPPPGNPHSENDQPGTGPGHPANAGGNPDPGADPGEGVPRGPRFGWMTGWGEPIILGDYTPVGDSGLYYIPRYAACTDAEVIANLTEAGYYANERTALLSPTYDSSSTYYYNRVKILLGVAGWKSKQKVDGVRASKYNGGPGNGDNRVDTNEICQEVTFQFGGGNWNDYISYTSGSNQMTSTDVNFKYRYGLKTFTNYLLENRVAYSQTPELAGSPEEPLNSVKDAVQALIDTIIDLDTQDHLSLEIFAQYGSHAHDLTIPPSPEELAAVLQEIPTTLNGYQAGHFTSVTNIGAGFHKALEELTSERARTSAAKVVILLTDGKPNVNQYDVYVGDNDPEAIGWAEDSAAELTEMGATIYTIGVGGDVNARLCEELAGDPDRYFFADNTPDPEHDGQPMYVTQLQQIFQTLGGKRPVRLIR
jgi:hypothetical protein